MTEPGGNDESLLKLQAELAQAEAEAAQAAAEAAAARAEAIRAQLAASQAGGAVEPEAETEVAAEPEVEAAPEPTAPSPSKTTELIREGYPQEGTDRLVIGGLVEDGQGRPDAQIAIPLATLNRHGLVAGATGTGKTRTLQGLAEGMSQAGIPVFLADIKGDLSGMAVAGQENRHITERTTSIGQDWQPQAFPMEFYSLGGIGHGVPLRTTVTDFGPLLLSKVLSLNETQESSLALIFHWADTQGLDLLDLKDLQATMNFLTSDEGKDELREIGGISSATAGVILRKVSSLAAQGGDVFFGTPEFDTADLLKVLPDGRGVISALELPELHDRPALFSTFLMWLLADLFGSLPEVGDTDKPKLVFFFDEAHLLFNDASKEFLSQVVQTVRLIRSKGVGIFFVTQSPKDVPNDVLAQLGARVQHALRAHTPVDARALREAVTTYPTSDYDLTQVLPALPTGEAIVTVLSEKGAPTPVAWTRIVAPAASMDPAPLPVMEQIIQSSPQLAKYGTAVDPESAFEILTAREQARVAHAEAAAAQAQAEKEAEAARKEAEKAAAAAQKEAEKRDRELAKLQEKLEREARQTKTAQRSTSTRSSTSASSGKKAVDSLLRSMGTQLGREITRTIFGTRKR